MLCQFRFKNYKSFKDETILDCTAAKMSEFSERLIKTANEKICSAAVIYGANGSGKSNLSGAFQYMTRYVKESSAYGGETGEFSQIRPTPFLFGKDTENAPTEFEVYFTMDDDPKNRLWNYGFVVEGTGILEEWLNVKAKSVKTFRRVFYREGDQLDLSGLPKWARIHIPLALENQALIVSLGAKLKVETCRMVRNWFLANICLDFADPIHTSFAHQKLAGKCIQDPQVQADVIRYLSSFDHTIKSFHIEKIPACLTGDPSFRIMTVHERADTSGFIKIPLEEESAGIRKMLALYGDFCQVIQQGGVLFIDDLDSHLHPLLVRNILLSFLDPKQNPHHAQLIMTSHESWLLSIPLLRRDEIWFVDKDEQGISSLYSLADFIDEEGDKIRKDESFSKNYLLGKYGAIPSLKKLFLTEPD